MCARPIVSIIVAVILLFILASCSQPATGGVTSEELKSVVHEAVVAAQDQASPSAEEIRAIVKTEVEALAGMLEPVSAPESSVHGECSSALNSCDSGSYGHLSDTQEQYRWKCLGTNGGVNATCSFCKPERSATDEPSAIGRCGSALNSCEVGTFKNLPDTEEYYRWQCTGSSSDINVACSKRK